MQVFDPSARVPFAAPELEQLQKTVPSAPRLIESAIERNAMVVAMERGTRWPSWIESFRRHAPNVVVIVQQPHENLDHFAIRIAQRKAILKGEPFVVTTAVLLAATHAARAGGRLRVASSLIAAIDLASATDRRFVIGTAEAQRPRSAYALLRLAERLSILASDTGLTISTRLWSESLKTPDGACR